MQARSGARPQWLWAIGSAMFVLAAISALQIFLAKQPYGTDLWAYVLAGRHLVAGDPLYPPDPVVPFGPFGEYHYAPATAVPFMLLAPLPFWLATSIAIGLNLGVAAAIGVYLIRPFPRDWQPWAAAGYVLFLPTTLEITLGQLNLVTVGLCLVAWSLRRRPVLAGIVLAVAIGVKLLPATLLLYYLASGRTRVVLTTTITGLAGLVLTWIVFPKDFPAYIGILAALSRSSWAADYVARGSPEPLAALLGSPVAAAALPLIALVSAIGGGVLARRDQRYETHLHHLALAFTPYLASFGLIWFTYLVTALPALATTLRWSLLASRRATRACLITGLALSWLLLQVLGDDPTDIVPIAAHLLGLVLLFALGILVLVFASAPERTGDPRQVAIATMR